jgi:Peptidase family M23
MPTSIAIALARLRMAGLAALAALMVAASFWPLVPGGWPGWLAWLAWAAWLAAFGLLLRAGTLHRPPVVVQPPVGGRWLAVNSPARRVPSHGVQAYGQAYAIDLVFDPPGGGRPGMSWWPPARRPAEFPGFGQPVLAPADGVVVRVHDAERDHWSRTSPLALLYLFTVELAREFFGPSRILGNHVVLDLGDGTYALLAHLRRRSVRVRPGQRVTAGQPLAECGNSGNTSEPHLHFQLMDHPSVLRAAGLPVRFRPGGGPAVLPATGQHLLAGEPAAAAG